MFLTIFLSYFCFPFLHASWSRNSAVNCTVAGQQLFCSDCYTANLCSGGVNVATLPCDSGKVCFQDGLNAYCTDVSSVPACECLEVPSSIPDNYDDQKYINCTENGPIVTQCPDGTVFNPNTSACASCINNTYTNEGINCTHYNASNTCGYFISECPPLMFFNIVTKECVDYVTFDCGRNLTDGLYPDSHNCSVFHYCAGGKEPGDSFVCPPGQIFNVSTCVANNATVSCPCEPVVPNYVNCQDGSRIFPTKNCKIYYTCEETSTGVYTPYLNECPGNFVFNPQILECQPLILWSSWLPFGLCILLTLLMGVYTLIIGPELVFWRFILYCCFIIVYFKRLRNDFYAYLKYPNRERVSSAYGRSPSLQPKQRKEPREFYADSRNVKSLKLVVLALQKATRDWK